MLVIFVTGYRNWKDRDAVFNAMDKKRMLHPNLEPLVVHGDAPGADTLAGEWARIHEYPCLAWPARWTTGPLGKGEGPERNRKMVLFVEGLRRSEHVVECLAFLHPQSRGTAGCIKEIERFSLLAQSLEIIKP